MRTSLTVSANPTVLSEQARALAKAKSKPMGAPSSGPRLREIMKYVPPGGKITYCYHFFSLFKKNAPHYICLNQTLRLVVNKLVHSPEKTFPFVEIADTEVAVIVVMVTDMKIMT